MNNTIKKLIASLKKKYKTTDLYELASFLNVKITSQSFEDLTAGFYIMVNRRKYIFINSDIEDEAFLRVVLAHELGHAILHPKENCAFMGHNTLLLTSKIERQANIFAAYFLIDDDMLNEYAGYTQEQFCDCTGYPMELLKLRLE